MSSEFVYQSIFEILRKNAYKDSKYVNEILVYEKTIEMNGELRLVSIGSEFLIDGKKYTVDSIYKSFSGMAIFNLSSCITTEPIQLTLDQLMLYI